MAFAEKRLRSSFSLEALPWLFVGVTKLVDTLLKFFFNNGFTGEFFVKL